MSSFPRERRHIVGSFVRSKSRARTGRNRTATDARGGRGANLTACRGGVRRTSSTSSTSTFGRSVGRRETERRFPAALRRSERLRTRREKRANGARELHVALGLPRRTRRGEGRARTRGGRETPSAQAIVRWNKFSSAPEGSKRAGLIAVLSSSQTAGRGGEARRRATRAVGRRRCERMGSGRERARGRLLLGYARSENRNNVAISRKTNEAFSKTGAAIGVVTPREKKKKPARARQTDGRRRDSFGRDRFVRFHGGGSVSAHLTFGRGSRIGDARGVAVASRSSRRVHRGRSDPIETRRRNPSSPRRAEGDCGRRRFIELSRFLGERAVGAP